jgi:hypothetical protein
MRAQATIGFLLAGCAYQAGTFDSMMRSFAGEKATIDCLDLAVERRPDLPGGQAVVAYSFGNRCDHPTVVDLASVAIVARGADGGHRELTAFDPHHEIESFLLDGRAVGGEAIAYSADGSITDICIDAASIAHHPATRWLCLPASRPQVTEAP